MSCPQCFTGHINPGTPTGEWETVHGLRTYVAKPPSGKEPLGIIVIIPDGFGVGFVNNQVLADHYASGAQYLVYLPDFMDGNEANMQTLTSMAHIADVKTTWFWKLYYALVAISNFLPFMYRNRYVVCWPRITSFLQGVRQDRGAFLPVGLAGFCWGGLYTIKLAQDTAETRTVSGRPLADAFFTAHPSNVTIPMDIDNVDRNLSIAVGNKDMVMGIGQTQKAKAILAAKQNVDSEIVVYPGAGHGFSVRASKVIPDSMETRQAEEAEQQAITWFQRQFNAIAAR